MQLICQPLDDVPAALTPVFLRVDRLRLARRRWRGVATDGVEFGFDLEQPLEDGVVFWRDQSRRYVIEQAPEPVLVLDLPSAPETAALLGWSIGNLHFPFQVAGGRVLVPDDPAVRATLDRLGLSWKATREVFRPSRSVAQTAGHGHSHATSPDVDFVSGAPPGRHVFIPVRR